MAVTNSEAFDYVIGEILSSFRVLPSQEQLSTYVVSDSLLLDHSRDPLLDRRSESNMSTTSDVFVKVLVNVPEQERVRNPFLKSCNGVRHTLPLFTGEAVTES